MMKRLFFVALSAVLFLGACNEKKGLERSEFSNPNILIAGADSIWARFTYEEDSVMEQAKANAVAEFEQNNKREMTGEEMAQLDREIKDQMKADYDEARHGVDSLKTQVVYSATIKFVDDKHMVLTMKTQAPGNANVSEEYEGTYVQEGNQVTLSYDGQQSVLVLSDDGNELKGCYGQSTYVSTLTKKK